MGKTSSRTAQEKLRLIGALQLGTYLFILAWMILFESLYIFYNGRNVIGQELAFPAMWVPFVLLGSLLIPSAWSFIQTGKESQSQSIILARTMQIALLVWVLLLTLPAYAMASTLWTHGYVITFWTIMLMPIYFVACVLGIVSFPIMWRTTKTLLSETIQVPVDENLDLIKQ